MRERSVRYQEAPAARRRVTVAASVRGRTMARGPRVDRTAEAEAGRRLEERIGKHVDQALGASEARTDAMFERLFELLGEVRADVRKASFERAGILARLAEVELAANEARDQARIAIEHGDQTGKDVVAEAVVEAAPEAVRKTPGVVWRDLATWQKAVAVAAGIVAILAGFSGALDGIERLASAAWHGAGAAWSHAKGED